MVPSRNPKAVHVKHRKASRPTEEEKILRYARDCKNLQQRQHAEIRKNPNPKPTPTEGPQPKTKTRGGPHSQNVTVPEQTKAPQMNATTRQRRRITPNELNKTQRKSEAIGWQKPQESIHTRAWWHKQFNKRPREKRT
jgi:hypothetical protein